jgi:hypothetical protein
MGGTVRYGKDNRARWFDAGYLMMGDTGILLLHTVRTGRQARE